MRAATRMCLVQTTAPSPSGPSGVRVRLLAEKASAPAKEKSSQRLTKKVGVRFSRKENTSLQALVAAPEEGVFVDAAS